MERPQAVTAVLAAVVRTRLLEGLEEHLCLLRRDAASGVDHREANHRPRWRAPRVQPAAVPHGVQAQAVAPWSGLEGLGAGLRTCCSLRSVRHVRRQRAARVEGEVEALSAPPAGEVRSTNSLRSARRTRAARIYILPPPLEKVEDLVDQREQVAARGVDCLGILPPASRERFDPLCRPEAWRG